MQQSPYLKVRRWSYQEATSPRDPSGTVYRPKGSQDFTPTWGQAALEDARDLDEYMIQHPSWPGVKNFSAAFLAMLHDTSHTELAPLFKCALGANSSSATLTIKAGGVHTNGTIEMNDTNLPAPIVQIEGDDGLFYERPVKSFNTGTKILTLAIKLPVGVLPVAVHNPTAGWQEDHDAIPSTFRVEVDRNGQTNELKGYADMCVPGELSLRYDNQGRLGVGVGWQGAEWVLGSAPNVQSTTKQTEQFLSFNSTCFLNDLDTPDVPNKVALRGFAVDFAPEFLPILGQTGNDGSDADPESNLVIWERGKGLVKGLTLQFAAARGSTGYTERENATAKGLFLRFKSKVGGVNSPTRVLSVWYPEIIPNDNPTQSANGGVEADEQAYIVGQSTLLSSATGLLTKCAVAFTEYP